MRGAVSCEPDNVCAGNSIERDACRIAVRVRVERTVIILSDHSTRRIEHTQVRVQCGRPHSAELHARQPSTEHDINPARRVHRNTFVDERYFRSDLNRIRQSSDLPGCHPRQHEHSDIRATSGAGKTPPGQPPNRAAHVFGPTTPSTGGHGRSRWKSLTRCSVFAPNRPSTTIGFAPDEFL